MGSFSAAVRNAWLDALARGIAYSNAQVWVKLHLGDPGAAGTDSPAVNATRMQATFSVAASAGSLSNTALVTWLAVPATETYTHVSLWSAATVGTFLGSDDLAAPASVSIGGDFTIGVGDLLLELT